MQTIIEYSDAVHRQQVIQLWKAVFAYDAAHNDPDLAIDRKLAVHDGLFFVTVLEGVVVGTIMAGYDGHRGWLYSVAVHPDYRQHGCGAALVRHAEAALIGLGCLKINLQILGSNAKVAAFYESLGFVKEPRVNMGKVIGQNVQRRSTAG